MHRTRILAVAAILALTLAGCQPADNSSGSSGGSSGGNTGGTSGGHGGADAPTSGPSGAVGNRDYTCEGSFQPTPTGLSAGASIKGSLWVKCPDYQPLDHHVALILEKDLNGTWLPKGERSWDGVPDKPMSIYLLSVPCVPGRWRIHAEIWGTSASGKIFATSTTPLDRYSQPKDVSASDCG